jgi:hypothetical protein
VKWAVWATFGTICLVIADKVLELGYIWPETSEKPRFGPRTVPKSYPSVSVSIPRRRDGTDVAPAEVVDLFEAGFRHGGAW